MIKTYLALSFVTVSLLFSILGQGSSCRSEGAKMSNTPALKNADRLAAGVWGGQHIRIDVTDDGARVDFDCAHSTIDQPILLDNQGRFNAKGNFTRERGGPNREGETADSNPVRYAGQVEGETMTLTVTFDKTGESIGDFTLTRGNQGRVMKCR